MLLEQSVSDLEEDTQRWVRHLPRTAEEALRLAEAFTALEGEYGRERNNRGTRVNVHWDEK